MAKRVTIQDIAEELGISRNTVSRAINNSGGLAEATREKILQKAVEMGYKQFSYLDTLSALAAKPSSAALLSDASRTGVETLLPDTSGKEIAILTAKYLDYSHFASPMLDKFQQELAELGYTMNTHRIRPEHIETHTLPATFRPERAAAAVCIEVFDRQYAEMVCGLDIPVLFVDAPAMFCGGALPADLLIMENISEIARFTGSLLRRGLTRIGFVGDYAHCQSFFERYISFRTAMLFHDVPVREEYCVKSTDRTVIQKRVQAMKPLPEAFICANDFLAIDVLDVLRTMGKSVPEDVLLCGFDDSPEAVRTMPPLTTIHIHTQIMAVSAVQLLLTRMRQPDMEYRIVHTQTDLVLRSSTQGAPGKIENPPEPAQKTQNTQNTAETAKGGTDSAVNDGTDSAVNDGTENGSGEKTAQEVGHG
ncbi:MAG: LacI family DNA-binding transcriptional regulator [Oscillibacter sp.]|nr:LacI family DNA-binding transcriptional regulator [Oscillibacter sp.]